VLKQHPNKQNEIYWAPCDPGIDVECREQGGQKLMCWAGVVQGKTIIHWFDPNISVNGDTYLEMLKNVVWHQVRGVATTRNYWFQKDGATVHTTIRARPWLENKFGDRVFSRLTDRPWPAKSPDLSPLDFWFWSVAMAELRMVPPTTLNELKLAVEDFAESIDKEEISKAVRHIRSRAQLCRNLHGGAFEAQLKKVRRQLANDE
jgi:hypothetical protein